MNILKDSSASPLFLNINNIYELFYKSLFKFFYFLYAPFVWEVKTTRHFLDLLMAVFVTFTVIFIKVY